MGRAAYLEDLNAAKKLDFTGISKLQSAEYGELTFTFRSTNTPRAASITASVQPDLSDYPESHEYMIFTGDESDHTIDKAVQTIPSFGRKTVSQLLYSLSKYLHDATATGNSCNLVITDSDRDTDMPDTQDYGDDNIDFDDDGDSEDWVFNEIIDGLSQRRAFFNPNSDAAIAVPQENARRDFIATKTAGFKVGVVGYLTKGSSCFVAVSCRIAKLGLSEETMQAWTVEPSDYLILSMYFPSGYKGTDVLLELESHAISHHVEFRVGLSKTYKPRSFDEAQRFFYHESHKDFQLSMPKGDVAGPTAHEGLRQCFISRPLDTLLAERLVPILKYRLSMKFSWYGAETYYNENQGKTIAHAIHAGESYMQPDNTRQRLTDLVQADQVLRAESSGQMAFPLIAMQFLLRHFVRCTDFCLVCHCKIDSAVEAVKPYVCDRPLCLFQYMSLGFGPSMEHEIITQPLVVDLLVSFCYASCVSVSLRSFPTGLGWLVPHPKAPITKPLTGIEPHVGSVGSQYARNNQQSLAKYCNTPLKEPFIHSAKILRSTMEMLLEKDVQCPVKKGDWIVVGTPGKLSEHCRVKQVMFPTIMLSQPLAPSLPSDTPGNSTVSTDTEKFTEVTFHKYNTNFDDLENADKAATMAMLLDLLPGVRAMRDYVTRTSCATLQDWVDCMSPAMTGLLRWIIASNRSCIMQVDEPLAEELLPDQPPSLSLGVRKSEERVSGMSNWLQFRFAMGSPEKEQRFIDSLHNGTPEYPTLFAWHGSPLHNWHGIIREGLNYNVASHGRAYGDGCYHASDFNTSMGYSGPRFSVSNMAWPHSEIKTGTVIALSEIVNAPDKFRSNVPYYVVQHLDWIQTRYLFAHPSANVRIAEDSPIKACLLQDPGRTPRGPGGHPIQLPASILPQSRRTGSFAKILEPRLLSGTEPPKSKRAKLTSAALAKLCQLKDPSNPTVDSADDVSVATLEEDLAILCDPDAEAVERPLTSAPSIDEVSVTSFKPGSLGQLQTLPPPIYATSLGSKTLQKAFRTLIATQDVDIATKTLPELGWWADPQHLEVTGNLYEWIIALHSFPLDLPLATDMQKQKLDAIVVELRFGANFPFSPPFVRVVRPRFLPFQQGGGGHVTAGGSICMDLLTNSGWSAAMSLEAVLLQIRMALMSTDPRPARLIAQAGHHGGGGAEYGVAEAVDAFVRACAAHGWEVPADIKAMNAAGAFGLGGSR